GHIQTKVQRALDEDLYFVSWDPELIPLKTYEPMDYTIKEPQVLDCEITIQIFIWVWVWFGKPKIWARRLTLSSFRPGVNAVEVKQLLESITGSETIHAISLK
ncbi:unnamed protein product, partial [Brassica oleracea]